MWIPAGAAGVAVAALLAWHVARKGRPRTGGEVYRASRLTRGNRLFPAQVIVSPTSVTLFTPQWIGKREESVHIAHVASIFIDTHLLFSDVQIETTGGRNPLICNGHTKGDAVAIKAAIEKYQTEYYRASGQR